MNIQPLLDFLTPIVVPDWGALVGLIPIGLLLLVVLWLALTLRAFASAGPTRRAPARVTPIAPAGVHMPGGLFLCLLPKRIDMLLEGTRRR